MKRVLLILITLVYASGSFAQNTDSLNRAVKQLEVEMMKKELEMRQEEIRLKQQEYEILKENNEVVKEDRKEIKTIKEKRERTAEEIEADRKVRMNKNTIISINPAALFIGGFDLGLEKKIANKKSLKLSAGYYYSQSPWYYEGQQVQVDSYIDMYGVQHNIFREGVEYAESFRFEIQAKFYMNPKDIALNGLYVAPFLQFKQMNKLDKLVDYRYSLGYYGNPERYTKASSAQMVQGGIAMGYQYVKAPIAVDVAFAAGLNFPASSFDAKNFNVPILQSYTRGAKPRFLISIGFPF